ncbi:MAG TPA: hypothetical protein EYN67_19140 [Flavobacteriales bacterium]|nr:hypothetical protein [Flavobacteriales bacterium]
MTVLLTTEELLTHIDNQKVLESALRFSRSQAWRVINGNAKLTNPAIELVMLKLNIHPDFKLTKIGK